MKHFVTLLISVLLSTVAKAQYTVSVTSDPEDNYFSGSQAFDPAEVATALGLSDASALQALITDEASAAVYIQLADESKSNAYTGNHNEFWMNADGYPQGYGDAGTCWYVGVSYDAGGVDEETQEPYPAELDVAMGQMPDYFKAIYTDSELTCKLFIVNGDKEVSFNVTLKVNAAAAPTEIADPVDLYSKLSIVKEYVDTLYFTEGKEYEGKTLEVNMSDLPELLGTTEAALADNMDKIVLTRRIEQDGESYFIGDSIFTPESLAAGSWFGRYSVYDEATGTETFIQQNAPHAWGTGSTYYLQSPTLADGLFTLTYGQFTNTMKAGDEDFAELYIVNGNQAATLKLIAKVTPQETVNPDEMVQVGETTVAISADIDNNYATKGFTIDMEAVVAALGCTTDDLDDIYAYAAEGQLSNNHTEGSGGFYLNEEGYIASWGSSSAFFVARTETSLADGKYTIGQMSGHFTEITEDKTVSAKLVFKYGANYYVVNVEYTVKAPTQKDDEFEYKLVSSEELSIQLVPNAEAYSDGTTSTLDLEYIESKIGTADFKLYADEWVDSNSAFSWTSNYTCTPAPGFWFNTETHENAEHQVIVSAAGWGTNSFGITYADGVITWYQFPGQRAAGDQYTANIYLVNEETGAYIKYILSVRYVEEVKPEGEIVGKEDTFVEMSDFIFDGVYYNVYIDMTTAFDFLGIEDPALFEACSILVAKSATMFETTSIDEDIIYGYDGYVAADQEATDILIVTVKIDSDGQPYLEISDEANLFATPEARAYIFIGLEYDGKRYWFVITLNKGKGIEINQKFVATHQNNVFNGAPNMNITPNGALFIEKNAIDETTNATLTTFSIEANKEEECYGQVISYSDQSISVTSDLSERIYTQDSTWYFLSLPFDCDLSKLENESGSQYAIRYYDGASRAANNVAEGNWKNFGKEGIIPMGTGFIFMTQEPSWTRFYAVDNENKAHVFQSVGGETTLGLSPNRSAQTRHSGWNLMGNPYANYYSIHAMDFGKAVTVWTGDSYDAVFPSDDDLALRPGQAFFVQCPADVESITLPGAGRQLTSDISSVARARRMADADTSRKLINLTLSDSQFTDKTRVVLNELASLDYELEHDAGKFMSMRPEVPQLFTIGADGTRYAINERPEADGTARLGVYIPQDGEYTLTMTRNDGAALLLTDSETGLTTDLAASGSYTFLARKGTYSGRFLLTVGTDATGIAAVPQGTDVGTPCTEYYDLGGRRILQPQAPGVYLQKSGTSVRKVLVK